MFTKVLVANRGEIAVRAFRAAYELGAQTVAVFPYEDRNAVHRIKADEAYEIGESGHPVRAYLDIAEIIRAARESGADAIYPGYGFLLGEPRPRRARATTPGITFVGPPADVLELAGNKVRALAAAKAAGVPTLRVDAAVGRRRRAGRRRPRSIGFPVFVKAVAGGGGRGMRRVDEPGRAARVGRRPRCARPRAPSATRPSSSSRPWAGPRHIEVQILADAPGNVDAPVRARLLDPAAPPEGRRDRARAEPRPRAARGAVRRRGEVRRSRSTTRAPAPSSSSSRPRASGPASTCSSR